MARSKLAKKIEKLEKDADKLRKKAEKKGKELQSKASDQIDDLDPRKEDKGGKFGVVTLVLAAIGAGVFALKKKRDQELDEALWEEPRSI